MRVTRIARYGAEALAFVAGLVLCLPLLGTDAFCLDDSFIHLAYAKSIHLGEGISYNPFDSETGFSSPLWLGLLSLWPFGLPSILAVKCLGALLHAASAALGAALCRECEPETPHVAWVAGVFFAATPLALQGATSGMEVPLATLLTLAFTLALLRERLGLAACMGGLAYLARPETLAFTACFSASRALELRSAGKLVAMLGPGAALLAFGAYCSTVSGHFWPNTFYVKGGAHPAAGLTYLAKEVLILQPVVASVAGLALLIRGLQEAARKRSFALPSIVLSGCVTLLAIACSRRLYPDLRFYQSRYFVIVLWVLPLAAACGLARLRRGVAVLLCGTLCITNGYLFFYNNTLQLAQERGVSRLHVDVARYVAASLPKESVIGVEGAGASRYFTPRSMRIVDLVGLNDRHLAHLGANPFLKLCYVRDRGVTHFAYPAGYAAALDRAFELTTLVRFAEPAYAQLDPPRPWVVTVARVNRPRADFAAFCAQLH